MHCGIHYDLKHRQDDGKKGNRMKINEESINHNIARLIEEYTQCIWEIDDDKYDHIRLMTLGYIRGVLELGEALKEVLKA